jgi:hypothetical protein
MPSKQRLVAVALFVTSAAALVAGGVASPAGAAPRGWQLPANAREVAPDVYEIGSKQVNGQTVTGRAFIHRRHDAKPSKPGGGTGGSTCYAFLAAGMKWRSAENYVVDPAVTHWGGTTDPSTVPGLVAGAIAQWEDYADGAAGGGSVNIMGDEFVGTIGAAARATIGVSMNGVNEVCFDAISDPGVIAVTIVWGNYGGNPNTRAIVEWDQIYDDDGDFTWGDATTDASVMDFLDICQHETGHAVGLDHPGGCTEETMYAYATEGETKKRTLNAGDIAGISTLY